jgi:hypothetical protein
MTDWVGFLRRSGSWPEQVRGNAAELQGLRELRQEFRHWVVLHEEFAELLALSKEEVDGLFDRAGGEVDGAHQVLWGGGDVQLALLVVGGQDMELPGLSAVQQAQAVGVDLKLFQIDQSGGAHVLLHPGVLNGPGIDPEESFGKVAERPAALFLHGEDVLHLGVAEDTLFDEELTDSNSWHLVS